MNRNEMKNLQKMEPRRKDPSKVLVSLRRCLRNLLWSYIQQTKLFVCPRLKRKVEILSTTWRALV